MKLVRNPIRVGVRDEGSREVISGVVLVARDLDIRAQTALRLPSFSLPPPSLSAGTPPPSLASAYSWCSQPWQLESSSTGFLGWLWTRVQMTLRRKEGAGREEEGMARTGTTNRSSLILPISARRGEPRDAARSPDQGSRTRTRAAMLRFSL